MHCHLFCRIMHHLWIGSSEASLANCILYWHYICCATSLGRKSNPVLLMFYCWSHYFTEHYLGAAHCSSYYWSQLLYSELKEVWLFSKNSFQPSSKLLTHRYISEHLQFMHRLYYDTHFSKCLQCDKIVWLEYQTVLNSWQKTELLSKVVS